MAFNLCTQDVLQTVFVWWEELNVVDVLRSATTTCGAQSVMMAGERKKLWWFADNWDS